MPKAKGVYAKQRYEEKEDFRSTAGAVSHTAMTTGLRITGTMAFTLSAPKFKDQRKVVYTDTAGSIPVGTLAVASCRGAGTTGTRTFAGFGTISASAPKTVELHSPDGATWRIVSMVGVTVS